MESVQTISKIPESQESLFFGELLVAKGLLSREELLQVLNEQRNQGGRLGEVLLRLKMLSDEDITAALSEHFDMEYIRFDNKSTIDTIDMEIARLLPESIATRFCLVAVGEESNKIVVAMADPLNVIAIDTVTLKLKPVFAV